MDICLPQGMELVDGALVERAQSNWGHGILQGWVGSLISTRYPKCVAGANVQARLRDTEYRIPDIGVQLRAVARGEDYAKQPPLLCVEILSPEDRLGATFAKCERYHDWGVPVCWVIDPMKQRAWVYERGGEPALQETVLEAGEISIPLAEVFAPLQ